MNIITKKTELSTVIEKLKSEGKTVGLVPTMGALHEGHISLVKACKKGNDIAVVSVFVNPTQFNDKEDLKRYPRTLDKDVTLLEKNGCDYVFAPSVEEMYPEEDTRVFDFGYVESVMEGARRPGHFNGVGQIVSKLFDIVRPHRAYFGMKDFLCRRPPGLPDGCRRQSAPSEWLCCRSDRCGMEFQKTPEPVHAV